MPAANGTVPDGTSSPPGADAAVTDDEPLGMLAWVFDGSGAWTAAAMAGTGAAVAKAAADGAETSAAVGGRMLVVVVRRAVVAPVRDDATAFAGAG